MLSKRQVVLDVSTRFADRTFTRAAATWCASHARMRNACLVAVARAPRTSRHGPDVPNLATPRRVAHVEGAAIRRIRVNPSGEVTGYGPSIDLDAKLRKELHEDPLVGPAVVLRACRASFLEISSKWHWVPASDSRAELDRQDLGGLDPAVSTPHQPAGAHLIEEVVATFLEIASLHADAMGNLCALGRLMLPIEALGRATLEATSHAVWVLGAGEAVEARDRLARAYLCEFTSAVRDMSVDSLRQIPTGGASARRREVLARCRSVFEGSTTQAIERGHLAGQEFPGLNAVVTGFIDRAAESGAIRLPTAMIRPIYSYLSTGAHPSLFRLREIREFVPHENHAGTQLTLPIETVRSTALLVAGLYTVALRTTADHFGWDESGCRNLYDLIEAAYPDALV